MACGKCPALLPTSCFQTEPELASSHRAATWPQMKNDTDERRFSNLNCFCFSFSMQKCRSFPFTLFFFISVCQSLWDWGFIGFEIFIWISFLSLLPNHWRWAQLIHFVAQGHLKHGRGLPRQSLNSDHIAGGSLACRRGTSYSHCCTFCSVGDFGDRSNTLSAAALNTHTHKHRYTHSHNSFELK